MIENHIPAGQCSTPQWLRLIYCDATRNWVDLNSLGNGTHTPPVPCVSNDCGNSCPLGLEMSGSAGITPLPIPAPGGSAVYHLPGGCLCSGTLEIKIDNLGPNTKLTIKCI
ncbi:MAG: hypothetical protein JXQ87_16725 [Bacteroidia bacterium]